jgi:hypothetical protein
MAPLVHVTLNGASLSIHGLLCLGLSPEGRNQLHVTSWDSQTVKWTLKVD